MPSTVISQSFLRWRLMKTTHFPVKGCSVLASPLVQEYTVSRATPKGRILGKTIIKFKTKPNQTNPQKPFKNQVTWIVIQY